MNVFCFYGNICKSIFVPQYVPLPQPALLAKLHSSLHGKWQDFLAKKNSYMRPVISSQSETFLHSQRITKASCNVLGGSSNQVQILARLQLTYFSTNFNNKILHPLGAAAPRKKIGFVNTAEGMCSYDKTDGYTCMNVFHHY